MAEFTEVMRQAKRMCAAHGGMCKIRNCPMVDGETCRFDADRDDVDYNEVERIIMGWAAEHPAPRYPTWWEWQKSTFSGASASVLPCSYVSRADLGCCGVCDICRKGQIPADIAEKLGIKPITTAKDVPEHDGCEGCRWMDKHGYEEPCKNCCGVMGGSTPDLWEER